MSGQKYHPYHHHHLNIARSFVLHPLDRPAFPHSQTLPAEENQKKYYHWSSFFTLIDSASHSFMYNQLADQMFSKCIQQLEKFSLIHNDGSWGWGWGRNCGRGCVSIEESKSKALESEKKIILIRYYLYTIEYRNRQKQIIRVHIIIYLIYLCFFWLSTQLDSTTALLMCLSFPCALPVGMQHTTPQSLSLYSGLRIRVSNSFSSWQCLHRPILLHIITAMIQIADK